MELQIEKLVYGGDGLARLPADAHGRGKTVFLPFVIPGEQVEATCHESRSGFVARQAQQGADPSPDRVAPRLPLLWDAAAAASTSTSTTRRSLRFKSEILRETLRRTAKLELDQEIESHASEPWNYRNRTRVRVQARSGVCAGLLPQQLARTAGGRELPDQLAAHQPGDRRRVGLGTRGLGVLLRCTAMQFFANHDDTKLLVEVYVRPQTERRDAASPSPTALMASLSCDRRALRSSQPLRSRTKPASARR